MSKSNTIVIFLEAAKVIFFPLESGKPFVTSAGFEPVKMKLTSRYQIKPDKNGWRETVSHFSSGQIKLI
jgi:hypothetical protein